MNLRLLSSNKPLRNVESKKLLILVLHRKQEKSTTDMAKVLIKLRILSLLGEYLHMELSNAPQIMPYKSDRQETASSNYRP